MTSVGAQAWPVKFSKSKIFQNVRKLVKKLIKEWLVYLFKLRMGCILYCQSWSITVIVIAF